MHTSARCAGLAAGLLLAAQLAAAQQPAAADMGEQVQNTLAAQAPAAIAAQEFRQLRVPGAVVRKKVYQLKRELTWHRDLDVAAAAAAREQKPIVWIQALGSLSGHT